MTQDITPEAFRDMHVLIKEMTTERDGLLLKNEALYARLAELESRSQIVVGDSIAREYIPGTNQNRIVYVRADVKKTERFWMDVSEIWSLWTDGDYTDIKADQLNADRPLSGNSSGLRSHGKSRLIPRFFHKS